MKKEERIKCIVARGEVSGHCHVIVGDCEVIESGGNVNIKVNSRASIRHLVESAWTETGVETWTKEHKDIPLEKGEYQFVQQSEYDPFAKMIQSVKD